MRHPPLLAAISLIAGCTAEPPPEPATVVGGPRTASAPLSASPSAGSPPFDRGAAARALSGVDLRGCAAGAAGHVTLTFENDGKAHGAAVDQGPLVGKPESACIEAAYGAATVPPFSGAPVRVGRSFGAP